MPVTILSKITSGQSILLPAGILRLSFSIHEEKANALSLFAALMSTMNADSAKIISEENKISSCGNVVLFGVENHWVYEIDLRCLKKRYKRIVFAISEESDCQRVLENPRVNFLANVEDIGSFAINTVFPLSRVLRIFEVYSYHGNYKLKAFGDFFPLENFTKNYCEINRKSVFLKPSLNIDNPKKNGLLRSVLSSQSLDANSIISYKAFVLGAQAVGKTSVLAAINSQLSKINATLNVSLSAGHADYYSSFLVDIIDAFAQGYKFRHDGKSDKLPIFNKRLYGCRLTIADEKKRLDLNLDFRESENIKGSLFNRYNIKAIRESQIILLPIDTPALMEQHGRWHESINKTRELADLLKTALADDGQPKMILLVPVKCETYLLCCRSENLVFAVEEHFGALLNFIRHFKSIACAMVPVQTLGHVILKGVKEEKEKDFPEFCFGCHHEVVTYSPRNADQLWIYILTFLIGQTLRMSRIKLLSAPPDLLHEALTALLSHRKQGAEGFKIFQGFREMG